MIVRFLCLFWLCGAFGFTFQDLLTPSLRIGCDPYITGDGFRKRCDFIFDETNEQLDPTQIFEKAVIFVGPYVLSRFFEEYHPKIQCRYILVTHNTDYSHPGPYAKYLDDEKLIAWFSQNVEEAHPKLIPIPIGLANFYTDNGNAKALTEMAKYSNSSSRDILAFLNLVLTHPSRKDVIEKFKHARYVTYYANRRYTDYLRDLTRSKFVFSPRGNGLDCHRTWEALYLGAIPIVKSSASDPMYDDLPVLIVKDWNEINEAFLLNAYSKIKSSTFNLNKLTIDFWIKKIKDTF